ARWPGWRRRASTSDRVSAAPGAAPARVDQAHLVLERAVLLVNHAQAVAPAHGVAVEAAANAEAPHLLALALPGRRAAGGAERALEDPAVQTIERTVPLVGDPGAGIAPDRSVAPAVAVVVETGRTARAPRAPGAAAAPGAARSRVGPRRQAGVPAPAASRAAGATGGGIGRRKPGVAHAKARAGRAPPHVEQAVHAEGSAVGLVQRSCGEVTRHGRLVLSDQPALAARRDALTAVRRAAVDSGRHPSGCVRHRVGA